MLRWSRTSRARAEDGGSNSGGPFLPLRDRNFARCFWASGISNTGAAMQAITIPFVIYEITGKRSWLGIAALLTQAPALVTTAFAGSFADRYSLKRMLLIAQSMIMGFAALFWFLWVTGRHSLPLLLTVVVANGAVSGIVYPLWQAFVSVLVPRELMASAVRLTSLQFAISRVLGPFVGGVVLEHWGPGVAFASNSVSYLFVMSSVMRTRGVVARVRPDGSPIKMLRDGWRYTRTHRPLLIACSTVLMTGLCGWALQSLAPALAKEQFGVSAAKVGTMGAVNGLGSVSAAIIISVLAHRQPRSRTGIIGLALWVVGIAIVGSTATFGVGLTGLYVMGLAHTLWVMSVQPAIMLQVDDGYRARVMSVYMQGVTAGPAIGALVFGRFSELVGLQAMSLTMAGCLATFITYVHVAHGGYRFLDADQPLAPPSDLVGVTTDERLGAPEIQVAHR